MSFPDAVRHALSHWSDFRGRARRSEFWWFVLFSFLAGLAAGLVDLAIFGSEGIQAVSSLVSLALLVPFLAVAVRRLHDTDRTGWWLLVSFVPIVGTLVLLWFYATRGQDGPNRFGPDPKGGDRLADTGAPRRSDVPRVDR